MGLPFSRVWELVSWALTPSGLEMTGCLGTEWPGGWGRRAVDRSSDSRNLPSPVLEFLGFLLQQRLWFQGI